MRADSFAAGERLHERASLSLTVKEAVLLDQLLYQYVGALWIQRKRRVTAEKLRKKIKALKFIR